MRRLAAAALLLAILATALGAAALAHSPLTRSVIERADAATLREAVQDRSLIEGRAFVGSSDAPITVAAYLDPHGGQSRALVREVYPTLRAYAENDTIRYYPRAYLSLDDLREKNERYALAKALVCIPTGDPNEYERMYLALFEEQGRTALLDDPRARACIAGPDPAALWHDAMENERMGTLALAPMLLIGIDGSDTRTLAGVPSHERLTRAIRAYEIRTGENP